MVFLVYFVKDFVGIVLFLFLLFGVYTLDSIADWILFVRERMAESISGLLLVLGLISYLLSDRIDVNFFQLMNLYVEGGEEEISEPWIYKRIGLWSEDCSFRLKTCIDIGRFTKAISKTSGLDYCEYG